MKCTVFAILIGLFACAAYTGGQQFDIGKGTIAGMRQYWFLDTMHVASIYVLGFLIGTQLVNSIIAYTKVTSNANIMPQAAFIHFVA